jgi:hypothetical protein
MRTLATVHPVHTTTTESPVQQDLTTAPTMSPGGARRSALTTTESPVPPPVVLAVATGLSTFSSRVVAPQDEEEEDEEEEEEEEEDEAEPHIHDQGRPAVGSSHGTAKADRKDRKDRQEKKHKKGESKEERRRRKKLEKKLKKKAVAAAAAAAASAPADVPDAEANIVPAVAAITTLELGDAESDSDSGDARAQEILKNDRVGQNGTASDHEEEANAPDEGLQELDEEELYIQMLRETEDSAEADDVEGTIMLSLRVWVHR